MGNEVKDNIYYEKTSTITLFSGIIISFVDKIQNREVRKTNKQKDKEHVFPVGSFFDNRMYSGTPKDI